MQAQPTSRVSRWIVLDFAEDLAAQRHAIEEYDWAGVVVPIADFRIVGRLPPPSGNRERPPNTRRHGTRSQRSRAHGRHRVGPTRREDHHRAGSRLDGAHRGCRPLGRRACWRHSRALARPGRCPRRGRQGHQVRAGAGCFRSTRANSIASQSISSKSLRWTPHSSISGSSTESDGLPEPPMPPDVPSARCERRTSSVSSRAPWTDVRTNRSRSPRALRLSR